MVSVFEDSGETWNVPHLKKNQNTPHPSQTSDKPKPTKDLSEILLTGNLQSSFSFKLFFFLIL